MSPDVVGPGARPDDEQPETWATGRLLSTAARLVEHAWDAHLSSWDLNHASFAVLWMLHTGPASQRELAQQAQVEDQTMSRMLERLARSGYVRRERSTEDRRRITVTLTDEGRRASLAAGDLALAESFVADAVPPGELDVLRDHLLAVVRHLSTARWGEA